MVTEEGTITEGSHSTVFGVRNGALLTAPLDSNILPGITRKLVLELADQCGIRVEEHSFTRASLHTLDELFVTSTIAEVLPVIEIVGNEWKPRPPGPITCRLQAAYRKHVGQASPG